MKYIVVSAVLCFCTAVNAQVQTFNLHVKFINTKPPSVLYLYYNEKTDSAIFRNGGFSFEGSLSEPVRATVREPFAAFNEQKDLYLHEGKFELIVSDSIQHSVVRNSSVNEVNAAYQNFIRHHKSRYDSLSQVLRSTNDDRRKDSIRPSVRTAFRELQEQQLKYVQEYPSSWMSLEAINEILFIYCTQNVDSATAAERFNPFKASFDKLDQSIRNSPTGQKTAKKIDALLASQVGRTIIPFSQKGHDGKQVSSGQYKGKYFLIDFWGSWCVWCRKGHPHLKELYNQYRSKGFEIIAVSKEFGGPAEQRKNWLEAIEKDNIRWKHIMADPAHDLTELYAIVAYPTKFLVDPTGKIILRVGDDDERKLDKILEEIYQ